MPDLSPDARAWGVFDLRPAKQEIHVIPTLNGKPLSRHIRRTGCVCLVQVILDREIAGPLGTAVISHREPGWPGAKVVIDA